MLPGRGPLNLKFLERLRYLLDSSHDARQGSGARLAD